MPATDQPTTAWSYQDEFLTAARALIRRVFGRVGIADVPRLAMIGVGWWSDERYENGPVAAAETNMIWRPDPSSWIGRIEELSKDPSDNKSLLMWATRTSARTLALRDVLADELRRHDDASETTSRCSAGVRVGSHDCAFVLESSRSAYTAQARIAVPHPKKAGSHITVGLLDALLDALLDRLSGEAQKGNHGFRGSVAQADVDLVLRATARRLLRSVHLAIGGSFSSGDLVDAINAIASLTYEAGEPGGAIILAAENKAGPFTLKFKEPVPLREATWARKTLEMAGGGLWIAANGESMLGLVERGPGTEDFWIRLKGRSRWELGVGDKRLADIHFGMPATPARRLRRDQFDSTFQRVFKQSLSEARDRVWSLVEALMQQGRGALLVVTEDAVLEAERLSAQATPVEPTHLDGPAASRVSAIDGAIILDATGTCHCVGAILDGEAYFRGTPSRGARFNSAARYVAAKKGVGRLAIVVSDDGYVDLLPRLRPTIAFSELMDIVDRALKRPASEDLSEAWHQDCVRLVGDYDDYLILLPSIGEEKRRKIIGGVLGMRDDLELGPTYDLHDTDLIFDLRAESHGAVTPPGASQGQSETVEAGAPGAQAPKAPDEG